MQCYTELLPPTAVTHAVALPFLSPDEVNLVVAKTSLLQVFKIGPSNGDNDGIYSRLLLVGEYQLSGTVIALRRISTLNSKTGADSLLVGSRDAKVSLVEWDQENYRISTTSIHYYEGESIPRQPCGPGVEATQSVLTVDPQSRCAALKFGQRHLAILPFRRSGDDLNELDGDVEMEPKPTSEAGLTNGESNETPYQPSFVLSLPSLDESLTNVVDLEFLHEYREPTFGILTSSTQASSALLSECRDPLLYHVLTLDLEQRASTILVSVPHLPCDLWKVVPLPLPVGGALLLGTNELLHVAQNGKTHAVSVNEFAGLASSFTVADQSALNLKLEDCVVELLDARSGDMLLALSDGALVVLTFVMQGPDVKGLRLVLVADEMGGSPLQGLPSCIASIDRTHFFVGSDEADSVLLRCTKQNASLSRKRSHAEMLGKQSLAEDANDSAGDDDDDDEDDLYTTTEDHTQRTTSSADASHATAASVYQFALHDKLQCLGPMDGLCFGRSSKENGTLEMVAAVGRGKASRLAIMSKELMPEIRRTNVFEGAKQIWSIRAVKTDGKNSGKNVGPDNFLFAYDKTSTKVYEIEATPSDRSEEAAGPSLAEKTGTEFEHDGETVDIGVLGSGRCVVQCRGAEIRTYDADLSLSQIIPMVDEESDAELRIVHTSFSDPYMLVIRDDGSLQVLRVDPATRDIEPLDTDPSLAGSKWISGSLYQGDLTNGDTAAFMLRDDGSLHILSLPNIKSIYNAPNPAHLPPLLTADAALRRIGFKETLTELLVADVGPCHGHKPYLVLKTAADDIILYEAFHYPAAEASWTENLRLRKVPVSYMPKYDEYEEENAPVRSTQLKSLKLGGQLGIGVSGNSPSLILSEAASRPKIIRLRKEDAVSLMGIGQNELHRPDGHSAFGILSRNGTLEECRISRDTCIGTGWAVQKTNVGTEEQEVRHIAFHEDTGMYVVSTCKAVDFMFTEDDGRHPEQDDIFSRPKVPQYSLHLFSAATRRIINSYELPPREVATCVEVMPMEVSEHTHELRPLVVVGTASLRGEDMPAKGAILVFEILPVVPEPGDSETGIKLHLFAREGTKGAVTAAAPFIGGLVGISQGQKLMVRGLKEDGSCLPVAFLDAQCQMATLKTLGQSGMWLCGDAWKGIWLGGFTEDPYKLTFMGKSRTHMEVVCAEFLPFEGQLFILVVDADMDLHVLQYDPENPKTASGTRLLHRSSFNLGHWPTSMTLVPSTLTPAAADADEPPTTNNGRADGDPSSAPLFHVLVTTHSGAVNLVTPVDGGAYRRLGNLHGQMVSILEHAAALNPREYRAVDGDALASRGVIDGLLIQRIGELGSARRAEVLARCGSDAWTLRSDLELIGGGGLGWL